MIRFVIKRLVAMGLILLVLTAVIFLLQKLSNTNPAHAYLGANASQAAIAHESHLLGYDQPLVIQYLHYVDGVLHGNLGRSLRTRDPVATDIGNFLPATLELAFAGLFLAVVMGGIFGLVSAARFRGAGAFRVLLMALASAPVFLLALLGILILSGDLHWLPSTGDSSSFSGPSSPTGIVVLDALLHGQVSAAWDGVRHLLLPAFVVAIGPAVSIGRVLRGSLEGAMQSDFIRTARAKGIKERTVVLRHALRNSTSAALSMTGLQVGLMFAGVVVVETIFSWPGIGLYTDQSIPDADFPAIAGVTLVLGVGYVVINAVVDILQAVVDPRVQLK
ncbi:MAG: ABC transporter permease [Acidimicrobiales bacterium]